MGYLILLHDFVVPEVRPSIELVARKGGGTCVLKSCVLPVLKRLGWATDGNSDIAWVCDVLVDRAIESSR